MIQQMPRVGASNPIASVLAQCSALLHPKLRRLLNPNVIDAIVRLQLHFVNGGLNHLRDADEVPAYIGGLKEDGNDNPYAQEVLTNCLRTIAGRLEGKLFGELHGVLILKISISGGEATISSEADWCRKPSGK